MTNRNQALRRPSAEPQENPLLSAALDYARHELPVFPCSRKNKQPLTPHGFKDATTSEQKIRDWWSQWPRAMIGMPTGHASGIDVLDLDLKPEEYVDGREHVPGWDDLSPVIARTPSGGAHVWFKSTGAVRNSTDQIGPGVDTRGQGGYVIVPPSYHRDGKYTFVNGGLDYIERLPTFPRDLFDRLGPRRDGQANADPEASPELIRAAMDVIPNPDLGWEDWNKFAMAIWSATGGNQQGYTIFDEWSQKSGKYNAGTTRQKWEALSRSPPTRIGAGTIFYHANESNPQWRRSAHGVRVLEPGSPVQSAFAFVQHGYMHGETPGLIWYRGGLYEWTGTHYDECDQDHVRSKLYEFLNEAVTPAGHPFNPTAHKVNLVIDALKSVVEQNSRRQTPFWIDQSDHANDPSNLIACRNGLLNIKTRELAPHSPLLFNLNALPFDYDRNAPIYPERWLKFLREILPDKKARFLLQEIFGLMLTPDTRHQKIFMVVGPARSGKGTIGRVLTALIGAANVVNPTLASMTGEFGLSQLIDKQVAIISDARVGKGDPSVIAERLLSISGEDGQTINRKYQSFWSGRLFVRFLILTNELPRIADASGALASRFVVLLLTKSFLGNEDPTLTDKLLTELPGILNWSLAGLERLRERRRFKMPQVSLDAIRHLEDLASPVAAFLRDWCDPADPAADQREKVKVLWDAWRHYCGEHGLPPGSSAVFGRNLRAVRPEVGTTGRANRRCYTGLQLSDHGFDEYQEARHRSRQGGD